MKINFIILFTTLTLFLFIPNAYSDWTISKSSINFGDVPVGSSKSDVVVITNTGATPLDFDFYPSLPELTTATVGTIPVAAGDSVTLVITFEPTSRGDYIGEILIASNDPNRPSRKVTITAISTYAIGIDVSPSSINFGMIPIGTSKEEYLRVGNNGESNLNVSITVTSGTPFTVSKNQFTLKPGQVETIIVTFRPTQKGVYTGALTVFSDDKDTPKVVVPLSGNTESEAEFGLAFSPTIMNFGNVQINTTYERILIVQNISSNIVNVSVSIQNITGSAFSLPESFQNSFSLIPGEIRKIFVIFRPKEKFNYSGFLHITTNTGNARVSLIGTGTETDITSLESQNPPPSSGGGGGGGCSVVGKVENTNFGNALLMFAPAMAIALRRFWRKLRK